MKMCGIFGILVGNKANIGNETNKTTFSPHRFKSLCNELFRLSESRGKEASGLVILAGDSITVYKENSPARMFIKSKKYNELFSLVPGKQKFPGIKTLETPVAAVGHSRLVTNGNEEFYGNNQPVIKNGTVVVHNGIIVNSDELWNRYPDMERNDEVDTEIIGSLTWKFYKEGYSIQAAVQKMYNQIEGTAAIAILFNELNRMVLATNNGSLYIAANRSCNELVFASEEYILKEFLKRSGWQNRHFEIAPLTAGTGCIIDINELDIYDFPLKESGHWEHLPGDNGIIKYRKIIEIAQVDNEPAAPVPRLGFMPRISRMPQMQQNIPVPTEFHDHFIAFEASIKSLKRCCKCILPGTIPFIEFDENGVCNICRNYKKHELKGEDALREEIEKYHCKSRRKGDHLNCIAALSGGRDSSFGLHYIKNILKLKPVSYTYDWGMVTDLARRNIARVCGKLGIENIVISADISKKRRYIRENVTAWLKKPEIGMIPLFMAGDKHFFYYVNRLKKQTGISLDIWCFNIHEKADFKEEFSGIKMWNPGNKKDANARVAIELRGTKSLLLGLYYTKNFLKNPYYLNSSLWDSFTGYISYYFLKKDLLSLYDYIDWNEKNIVDTLIKEYKWEVSPDTKSTWRIGDGTASFYNYIYYAVTGFTENDWFRSNQIREGMIDRETVMDLIYEENKPRWDSIKWYCNTIGIDYCDAIRIINDIPKLYNYNEL